MIIDSQVHAFAADTPERPWQNAHDGGPPHATGDEHVAAMDRMGVDGAILVSTFTLYHYDASYAMGVQRAYPGRFALVKPVDPDDPAVDDVLAEWKSTPGAVGIRIRMPRSAGRSADDPGLGRLAKAVARQGLAANLICWGNLEAGTQLIDRHPETRFVLDHLGLLQPHAPDEAMPEPWADLPKVLELARRPNASIKVSGACTLSRQGYPYDDIWDPLARIFDAWGFERCLWGTDWTRTANILSYPQGIEPFRLTQRLSESERAMLMGGACAKTYGWSPQRD